jgi:hypothetical protein
MSQTPVLEPEIGEDKDPHKLKIKITNIGNGLARNIIAKIPKVGIQMAFGSDLLPRKHERYKQLTLDIHVDFEAGKKSSI